MRAALVIPLLAWGCASRALVLPATAPWPSTPDAGAPPADVLAPPAEAPADAGPTRAPLRGATALRVSRDAACALRDDGSVWCWYGDDHTAHAEGAIEEQFAPSSGAVAIPGLRDVADVCFANETLCALRRDGSLVCRAVLREAANAGPGEGFDPVVRGWTLPDPQGIVAIESDPEGCLLRRGDGRIERVRTPATPDAPWRTTPDEGTSATGCALVDGVARCWGDNARGLLENSTTRVIPRRAPVTLFGLRGVRATAFGERHACAVLQDGTLRCWGRNLEGQLGTGDRRSRALPTAVPGIDRVVGVGVGRYFTCALREDGDVRCFGINRDAELGDGTTQDRLTPTPVEDVRDAVEMRVEGTTTCARTRGGEVWCWGHGTLDRAREAPRRHAMPVMAAP